MRPLLRGIRSAMRSNSVKILARAIGAPRFLSTRRWGGWREAVFPELREIREIREIKKELSEMKALSSPNMALAREAKAISTTLKHIQGYMKNCSLALEEEVVLAVCDALRKIDLQPVEIFFDHAFTDTVTGTTACRPDGLIFLGDGLWAVVEVGQCVSAGTLSQMAKTTKELTGRGYKISHQFVGGPSFKKANEGQARGIKDEALMRGYGVVVVTGQRYEVVFPPPPPTAAAAPSSPVSPTTTSSPVSPTTTTAETSYANA